MMKGINWLGVLVALIVSQIIGFVWYGMLMAEPWMAASGMTEADMQSSSSMSYLYGILQNLVVVFGIAWVSARTGMTTMRAAATAGLWACFFFALPTYALRFIYGDDSTALWGIDVPYMVLQYVLSGAIIGALRFGKKAEA